MITLHHLETSRSSRIIWLLEALGIDYELVMHKRGPDMRAPEALKQIHPLGKAPAIVDGDLVIAESGTILRYICERHGDGRFAPPAGTDAATIHAEWLDYAESSLMTPVMIKLIGRGAGGLPPALDHYATTQLDRSLAYVAQGIGDGPFLMGDEPTLADIQMSYCMAVLEIGGVLEGYPALQTYWQRLQAEPGFARMIEVGGPLVPRPR